MLSERESVAGLFLEVCRSTFLKIVSVFEIFVNWFCSLSSNLRAAVVIGSVEDGQEKKEHRF